MMTACAVEMYRQQVTFDCSLLQPYVDAGKLRALYVSAGDEWAPLAMERRLAAAGVPTTIMSADVLSHMFSCSEPQARVVTDWVCEQIRGDDAAPSAPCP